jgi:hypothetical protein
VTVDVSGTAVDLDADVEVVVNVNGGAVVRFAVGIERAAIIQLDTPTGIAGDVNIDWHSADLIAKNHMATVAHPNALSKAAVPRVGSIVVHRDVS